MQSHVCAPNYNVYALESECVAKPETLTWKTLLSKLTVLQRECIAKPYAVAGEPGKITKTNQKKYQNGKWVVLVIFSGSFW